MFHVRNDSMKKMLPISKSFIFIGVKFREKLVSHYRAANEADSSLHTRRCIFGYILLVFLYIEGFLLGQILTSLNSASLFRTIFCGSVSEENI